MIQTAVTEILGIAHPICSAGMARVAHAELLLPDALTTEDQQQ